MKACEVAIGLLIGLAALAWGCSGPKLPSGEVPGFPANYPVLHPKFREWPVPALGMDAKFNPPSLLWPAQRKKGTAYNVRLSQDSSFQSPQTILAKSIPWAMFNPHQKLAAGTWYWQYQINNENWSALNSFEIDTKSIDFESPPIEKFWSAIPVEHPRVLLDAEGLAPFRNEVGNLPDAKTIIENADRKLNSVPLEESAGKRKIQGANKDQNEKLAQNASKHLSDKMYQTIDPLCKAYVITGNEKYARTAIAWAMKIASWDPEGLTGLSDFGDARCMVSMALVYDTFFDQLTPGQKASLLAAIKARAGRFYHDWVNTIDPKLLSNHVWQYILDYFLSTAVAVYGDVDEAKDWINYSYELWLARAPVLGGDQGGWVNGASYFRLNMETLLNVPTIIKNYTGFDFIKGHPWYRENPYWMIYAFPPGSSSDGFGDDTERIFAPGLDYLAYSDALGKLTGSEAASWYSSQISNMQKIQVGDADMLRWFRLRYLRNLDAAPAADPKNWPQSRAFYDVGVVEMHNDIANTPNDMMVAMRSSPYGSYGHMLADQNTFNVLVGGRRLFYTSGYKVTMGDPHRQLWYKHTRGHNGILIDGKGQPYDVEAYGWIARFLDGKSLSYAVGDASQAYSSKAEKQDVGLKKFRRHILYLRPDIVVVYDELEADHDASWSWLVHSPQKIQLDSLHNAFDCDLEKASSKTGLFSSQAIRWSLADTFAVPVKNWTERVDDEGNLVEYKNDQWHLTASSVDKTSKMRFMAIIQVSPDGHVIGKPMQRSPDKSDRFLVGNWTVTAELDVSKPALLEAHRNDNQVAFTSSSQALVLGSGKYRGKIPGSSKLVEIIDGKPAFAETGDHIPRIVDEIQVHSKK